MTKRSHIIYTYVGFIIVGSGLFFWELPAVDWRVPRLMSNFFGRCKGMCHPEFFALPALLMLGLESSPAEGADCWEETFLRELEVILIYRKAHVESNSRYLKGRKAPPRIDWWSWTIVNSKVLCHFQITFEQICSYWKSNTLYRNSVWIINFSIGCARSVLRV
jgi:hypothetical protein